VPRSASSCNVWESTALERVAARHSELHDTRGAAPTGLDWEQRAVECLWRYFRAHR
jgi:hypothetical protein